MDILVARCFLAALYYRVECARMAGASKETCRHCGGNLFYHFYGGEIDVVCRWCTKQERL